MDEKEVDSLVKEAEEKREEDKKRKEAVDSRNMAESTVYQAEKMINDSKDKIEEADLKDLEEKIKIVKEIIAKADATKEDFETPNKELNDAMMKVGQKLHQAGATPEAGAEQKADD
jgi:molecular chaperone DnaK